VFIYKHGWQAWNFEEGAKDPVARRILARELANNVYFVESMKFVTDSQQRR